MPSATNAEVNESALIKLSSVIIVRLSANSCLWAVVNFIKSAFVRPPSLNKVASCLLLEIRAVIEAVVGTPLGNRIVSFGHGDNGDETWSEPDALLAAARGGVEDRSRANGG